jgi:hypothetical protein
MIAELSANQLAPSGPDALHVPCDDDRMHVGGHLETKRGCVRREPRVASIKMRTSVRTPRFLFLRSQGPASCVGHDIRLLLEAAERANHVASHGLIWPKDGCASIAWPQRRQIRLSSPGLRPFLAGDKKVSLPPSSAALRPEDGCVRRSLSACRSPSRPRWSRARTAKEK